jgi:hypothetical protein
MMLSHSLLGQRGEKNRLLQTEQKNGPPLIMFFAFSSMTFSRCSRSFLVISRIRSSASSWCFFQRSCSRRRSFLRSLKARRASISSALIKFPPPEPGRISSPFNSNRTSLFVTAASASYQNVATLVTIISRALFMGSQAATNSLDCSTFCRCQLVNILRLVLLCCCIYALEQSRDDIIERITSLT